MSIIFTDKIKIEKVQKYIANEKLAVVSTVSSDFLPESAVIGFSEAKNLELFFGTFVSSRKYRNIKTNPRVALVIGWDKGKTVQYEGIAEELHNPELKKTLEIHLAKFPTAIKYVSNDEEAFFKVRPKWVRYSDLHKDPWEVFEIIFP